MSENNQHWATLKGQELAGAIDEKVKRFQSRSLSVSYYSLIQKLFQSYYGINGPANSYQLTSAGDGGEETVIHVNLLRSLVQQMVSTLCGKPIAFSAVPKTSDAAAIQQGVVAEAFSKSIVFEKDFVSVRKDTLLYALLGNESYVWTPWNFAKGDVVMTQPTEPGVDLLEDPGAPVYAGDCDVLVLSVYDVIRDSFSPKGTQQSATVRSFVNKYDLAAQYPEFADQIICIQRDSFPGFWGVQWNRQILENQDIIPIYTTYHERTPAVPDGLEAVTLTNDLLLTSGPLGYERIPLVRVSAEDVITTDMGMSPLNDTMALTDALDGIVSSILSKQGTLGKQVIQSKRDNNLQIRPIGNNIMLAEVDRDYIQPYEMSSTPPELYQTTQLLQGWLQQILGQNPVSLGQVDPSSRLSTESMSILENKAIQHLSSLSESLTKGLGGAMTNVIKSYQKYATAPRVIRMVGDKNRPYLASFSSKDIEHVDRVYMELGNPLSESNFARYDMASKAMQSGLISNLPDLSTFLTTGDLPSVLEGPLTVALAVKDENEQLCRGIVPPVSINDDPMYHVQHHAYEMSRPDVRANPALMQAFMQHIGQHILIGRQTPPELAVLFGHTPMPPVAGPQQGQAPAGNEPPQQ